MRPSDDTSGLIGDLIRIGVIASVDLQDGKAVVRMGEVISPPLPWLELAGQFRTWCPPSENEQVLVLCMEADVAHGVILRGLFSSAFPQPASGLKIHLSTPDGTVIAYDAENHALKIDVAGAIAVTATQGLTIDADVTITGKVNITGDVAITGEATATVDVKASDISLKNHKHGAVQAGPAKTGAPE